MASVDKIYATKDQYETFREWCNTYNKEALRYFYFWESEWNDELEHPITNFPERIDMWMLKNCPIDFVVKRIREQYGL